MKYLHKLAATAAVASMALMTVAGPVFAQSPGGVLDGGDPLSQLNKNAGFGNANLFQSIGYMISIVLRFVGVIAILLVIYGGFKWMTAGGSEEKVEEAKKVLYSGAIGMIIIFSAYGITSLVIGSLAKSTGTTGVGGL